MTSPDSNKKPARRQVYKKPGRWDQSSDRLWRKWNKTFQDKFRSFQDVWVLKIAEESPSSINKWEGSLEERLSMASKCKDCNHVWVTDNGLVCFYYLFNKSSNGNADDGEVLVWLKPQSCPNKGTCCSTNVPLMDVYQDEVDAVLSYLMMEIGLHCYQREYTKNDEDAIENRRVLRGKKMKKANKTQRVGAPKTGARKIEPSLEIKPVTAKVPGDLGNPKPVKTQHPVDPKRSTKLRNRWDRTPEDIKNQWELAFRSKFDNFTAKKPLDRWVMSMEKVAKNHPLRREKKWERFLGEKVEAGFICPKCNYVWESRRAWISFWIWQNPPDSNGERLGEVVVHVLGQKCAQCPGSSVNKPYIIGDLQGEEIDVVLSYLYMEIDHFFYDNNSYTEWDEKLIEEKQNKNKPPVYYFGKGIHRKESCQACREKVCKLKVTAAFPGPILPPDN